MKYISDYALSEYNTLGFRSVAQFFAEPQSPEEIEACIQWAKEKQLSVHVLGGGSNVLLAPQVNGLVLKPALNDISFELKGDDVLVTVGAGTDWHELVRWTVERGWSGIESMALIPGSVGAAPVQNIGAYGTELKDVFYCLTAFDTQQNSWVSFTKEACNFAYRDSRFKQEKGRFIIAEVVLKLSRTATVNVKYDALTGYLSGLGIDKPSLVQVFDGVCAVRRAKLPDPNELANAGSFFKNPVISADHYQQILEHWPTLVGYPEPDGRVKVAAGWLIDKCQWKGYRQGPVGVYEKQALVLVHYGGGTRDQLLALASDIKESIHSAFGIDLEIEPQLFPR